MHVENIQKVREVFERILSDRDARLIFLKTDDNVFRALDYNPITLVGLNKDVDYNLFLVIIRRKFLLDVLTKKNFSR